MLRNLRWLGFVEGVSLLVLLFVAMPIKYVLGNPMMVRWVGSAHGGLFVLFCIAAFYVGSENQWSLKKIILAIFISTFPGGPFLFDRMIYGKNVD